MAIDMFLKLDGIDGESTDSKHKNEIEISSFSWGASNPTSIGSATGGIGAGKVHLSDLNITTGMNKASPKLFLACSSGQHIATGTLSVRKAGGTQLDYLTYTLTEVLVSSYNTSGGGGSDTPMESISLAFAKIEMSYAPQGADGKLGSPVKVGWNVTTNVKV
ncbi:MAG TPA: type VI secretion system tube protein Hcp [Gemmatimonadaceae bacterium]|nr:type VI secretion system tube protein Hcp [Gemmatimonadaceae bacterium]